jgi:hypothetical protein
MNDTTGLSIRPAQDYADSTTALWDSAKDIGITGS